MRGNTVKNMKLMIIAKIRESRTRPFWFWEFVSVFVHEASKTSPIFSAVNLCPFEKGERAFFLSPMRSVQKCNKNKQVQSRVCWMCRQRRPAKILMHNVLVRKIWPRPTHPTPSSFSNSNGPTLLPRPQKNRPCRATVSPIVVDCCSSVGVRRRGDGDHGRNCRTKE